MLIETEGRNYTAAEYTAWLKDAGFVEPPTAGQTGPASVSHHLYSRTGPTRMLSA